MPILLFLARILAFLNFYILPYRKKLVMKNLANSFPDKSRAELDKIARQFYRVFYFSLMETLKLFSVDISELKRRTSLVNPEVFDDPDFTNKCTIGVCGHLFNWEWLVGIRHLAPYENLYGIYHPIKNEFWNEKLKVSRAIAGSKLISSFETKELVKQQGNDGKSLYLFLSDQSPAVYKKPKAFVNFLNQKTAVLTGWEELAREKGFNVVYIESIYVKPGHYQYKVERILPDNPEGFAPLELIHKYHHLLEESIQKQPFNYLWSHKKWKHRC